MLDICIVGFGGKYCLQVGLICSSFNVTGTVLAIGALYGFALEKSSRVRLTVVCRSVLHSLLQSLMSLDAFQIELHDGERYLKYLTID
jgi:hypothetical protein